MKRTIIILVSILVGVFIVFSALAMKGDYAAEKALHKINVQFNKIKSDPVATPDASYTVVIDGYKKYMEKYSKSRLAQLAHLMIARTFMLKKDYVSARETYERINQQYSKELPGLASQALSEIAASYASEDNIGEVLKIYERLMRDLPTTDHGMSAPLIMAKILSKRDPLGADRYFESAIMHYRSLMQKYPETVIGFKALNFIASIQMAQGKWDESINIYSELILSYSNSNFMNGQIAMLYLRTINTLSILKLGDFDRPVGIYEQFISKYPDHPLNPTLEKMISGIKDLKQKHLEKAATKTE